MFELIGDPLPDSWHPIQRFLGQVVVHIHVIQVGGARNRHLQGHSTGQHSATLADYTARQDLANRIKQPPFRHSDCLRAIRAQV